MCKIINFEAEKRKKAGYAGLTCDGINSYVESLQDIANILYELHHLAENYIKNDLNLPVENFTRTDISDFSVEDFIDEKKPITVIFSGNVDGKDYRLNSTFKKEGKYANIIFFTEMFNGTKWEKTENDDYEER